MDSGDNEGISSDVTELADSTTETSISNLSNSNGPEHNLPSDATTDPTDILKSRRIEEEIDEGLFTLTIAP